jgi:hypothetical protein
MKSIVDGDVVLSQPVEGPLSAHIAALAAWAREQGYARWSRYRQVLLAACFNRWLLRQGVHLRTVSDEHAAQYLRPRARGLRMHRGDAAALRQFLEVLRHQGVIPPASPRGRLSPVEHETQAFEAYLRNERVLADPTEQPVAQEDYAERSRVPWAHRPRADGRLQPGPSVARHSPGRGIVPQAVRRREGLCAASRRWRSVTFGSRVRPVCHAPCVARPCLKGPRTVPDVRR